MTEAIARRDDPPVPLLMPVLLSFVAGYLDSYTYLSLFGLFAAQVTGSFVIAGAEFVTSDFGIAGKLIAIAAFVTAAAVTAAFCIAAHDAQRGVLSWMLGLESAFAGDFYWHHGVRPSGARRARLARHRRWRVCRHGDGRAERRGPTSDEGHSADQCDDRQYDAAWHRSDRIDHGAAAL